jgi:REP element-mobilizing transposase RayT
VATWLITSTTYGTWLPGDPRGFVGRVWDGRPGDETEALRIEHDQIGTEYDRDIPGLHQASHELMKGDPVLLTIEQARMVIEQFESTANYRNWTLHAASVMANHFHLVVTAEDDVLTDQLLKDFKSYASRILNKKFNTPKSGTWWTQSGSRRRLPDDRAITASVKYVNHQHGCLALFTT